MAQQSTISRGWGFFKCSEKKTRKNKTKGVKRSAATAVRSSMLMYRFDWARLHTCPRSQCLASSYPHHKEYVTWVKY